MSNDIYKVTPGNGSPHTYFVKAVSASDALLTLTELGITLYVGRTIEPGVSPAGHHLIVSANSRKAVTKPAPPELDPNDERFKGTQAHAILAGNMFMPGNEEEIPVIRTLLSAAYREEENARAERDKAKDAMARANSRLDRAGKYVDRTNSYLTLTVNDLAQKEARK